MRSSFTPTTRVRCRSISGAPEQDRLSTETAQAERQLEAAEASFGNIAETLARALDLLADCQRAYLAAPGHLRRQWNQALFERLVICDERIADAEVA